MALFDKMKDSITIAGQGVSQKARSATESVRIGNLIKANDRMIEKLTYQVGLQCVSKYVNDPNSEYAALFSEILRLRNENQRYQAELQQATAVNPCPHCGFGNNMAAKFCISCGAPLTAAPTPAPAAGGCRCPKCGFANAADAAFCVECGTRLDSSVLAAPPNTPVNTNPAPVTETFPIPETPSVTETFPITETTPVTETSSIPEASPITEAVPAPEPCISADPVSDDEAAPAKEPVPEFISDPEPPVQDPETSAASNICKNCGAELDDDSLFCTKCGTRRS